MDANNKVNVDENTATQANAVNAVDQHATDNSLASSKNVMQHDEKAPAHKKEPEKQIDTSKKTRGEKLYGWLNFWVAELTILALTAVIAYTARYGKYKEKYKTLDSSLHNKIGHIGKEHEIGKRLASNFADTTVTFWGGAAFAPVMYLFHNKKKDIVGFFNRKFGEEGEEVAGNERLKDEPKKTWGSVIIGRVIAWSTVFASFSALDFALGKSKKNNEYHFKNYVDGFGNYVEKTWSGEGITGKFKKGWEALPWRKKDGKDTFTPNPEKSKSNKYGKILALDIYATTAAIIIWELAIKHLTKRKTRKEEKQKNSDIAITSVDTAETTIDTSQIKAEVTPHTTKETARREKLQSSEMEIVPA